MCLNDYVFLFFFGEKFKKNWSTVFMNLQGVNDQSNAKKHSDDITLRLEYGITIRQPRGEKVSVGI